ncbi:CheR family methyltransferase [Azospirillum sp. B510]|uniref:CheR family methyltransferase n=1 Tax=Azospirillum sp. (strain B510) TaxID=137722 RepID=UPI00031AF147|nr:CheR family methyltransferase [Azospirillum sp. B510]
MAVGASAGGLKAITALLNGLPTDSRLAVVVIQHRTPHNESLLIDLLSQSTALPIATAESGMVIEAGHIYIAPAGRILTLSQGAFAIAESPEGRVALPIDAFFSSLGIASQQNAICVVLSGTGADGSIGLKVVKECGGLVVAQDPTTAEFDSMPCKAIATGLVDYVLAPDRMAEAIAAYVRQPYVGEIEENAFPPDSEALDHILGLMEAQSHRDYRAYKTRTLMRRIERRMGIHQIGSLRDYSEFLGTHPAELEQLSRDILISVTRFFRDPDAFALLDETVLTPMVRDREPGRPIRVWVPGCATGEEAYSIAMLLLEACAAANKSCDIKVFGSDVDKHALEVARAGTYPETIAADVSPQRLSRFFTRVDGDYKVTRTLREAVSFALQNMISDPPFSNLDLISCRNVLIYIDPSVQQSILELFHFGLAEGGTLFLGSAEGVNSRGDLFTPLSKKWRLFRKLGHGRRTGMALQTTVGARCGPVLASPVAARVSPAEITRQALLLAYAPAAVLIDLQHRLLYLYGPTGDFLDLPTGELPQDLMAMMRGDLRIKVRAALEQAVASGQRVNVGGIRQKRSGALVLVTVTVTPVSHPRTSERLLLVTFARGPGATAAPAAVTEPEELSEQADLSVAEAMEHELRVTREELSATIQELEASNEALRAANEEILSVNEELQSSGEEMETSKEELQSLNEELSTVNSQLQEKVDELEAITNDLTNLLTSTDIATLFLSPDLRVKRFTAPATRLFSLIPTDIGRPITDVARHFADPALLDDLQAVLASLTPREREVETADGATLLRHVHPYRTQDNRIEGTVITFSDVTPMKRVAATLSRRVRQQRLIADLGRRALEGEEPGLLLHSAAGLIADTFGADRVGIFGPSKDAKGLVLLEGTGWTQPDGVPREIPIDPSTLLGQVFWSKQPLIVGDFAADRRTPGVPSSPEAGIASGVGVAFGGHEAKTTAVLALYSRQPWLFTDDDIEFVQAVANILGLAMERSAIQDAVRAARDFAEAIVDTVREPLLVLNHGLEVIAASQSFYRMFATSADATLGHRLSEIAGAALHDETLSARLAEVAAQGTSLESLELIANPDGADPRSLLLYARPLNRSEHLILLGIEDVTERNQSRQALAAAKAMAEQASAGKTRFLAAASHDLRQPVQAAVLFQHLLSTQDLPPASARVANSLGNTLTALQSMLDEILHISRLDAGVVNVNPKTFLLSTLLNQLVEEFSPLAGAAGLKLKSVRTSLTVHSDPKLLSRILQNLLANAVKYTDAGRILIGCRRSADTVRIQVWDTGRGIPEGQLAAIFEEFHQIGNLERDRRQGLGLGLSIVDRLATLLQHPIAVRSKPGSGSVFEVAVPLAGDAARVEQPFSTTILNGGNRDILVIDDDPVVLDSLCQYLDQYGFKTTPASDRVEALERFSGQSPPRLIIADYRLRNDETGADVIRRLRKEFGAAVPGIILTGDTSPDRIREASRSGFMLLHKPISPAEISLAISNALTDEDSRREITAPGLG